MYGTVSNVSLIGMGFSAAIAILLPIILMVVWKIKTKIPVATYIIGMATFFIFALILEQILHAFVVSDALASNIWAYALYGGLAAAVFEEVGRYVCMNIFLKRSDTLDKANAIGFGIGHGGFESIVIVGFAQLSNIATSMIINGDGIDTLLSTVGEGQEEQVMATLESLWSAPSHLFYFSGIERISTIILHIALSYFVYQSVKYGKKLFFVAALALHFVVDFGTVVLNTMIPAAVLEILLLVVVCVLLAIAISLYKKEPLPEPVEEYKDRFES